MKPQEYSNQQIKHLRVAFALEITKQLRAYVIPSPDGKIHRFDDPAGEAGNNACWYVLSQEPIPHGAYGNWRTGSKFSFRLTAADKVSPEQKASLRAGFKKTAAENKLAKLCQQSAAAERARKLWAEARPADRDHPYLLRKKLSPLNLRQYSDCLLVPLIDESGRLVNMQTIQPSGSKRFLKGGKVKGAFSLIGNLELSQKAYLCEGWATGATLNLETSFPVACALSCHNLSWVGSGIKRRYPNLRLVVAGDDDRVSRGNPGRTAAIATCLELGIPARFPQWPEEAPEYLSDFNDLYLWRKCHEKS